MKRFLFDTDVFIDFLRGFESALKLFEKLKTENTILFSSIITEIELLGGKDCEDISKRRLVDGIISLTTQVNLDNSIVSKSGELIRKYGLEVPDAIIAATTFISKAILITRNVEDFKRIKEIKVIKPY